MVGKKLELASYFFRLLGQIDRPQHLLSLLVRRCLLATRICLFIARRHKNSHWHPLGFYPSGHICHNPGNTFLLLHQLVEDVTLECDEVEPQLMDCLQVEILLRFQQLIVYLPHALPSWRRYITFPVQQHQWLSWLQLWEAICLQCAGTFQCGHRFFQREMRAEG